MVLFFDAVQHMNNRRIGNVVGYFQIVDLAKQWERAQHEPDRDKKFQIPDL